MTNGIYKRVRVTTLGQSLPVFKHLLMTPHPHPHLHPGAVLHTFAFASLTISSETTGFRVFFVPD